MSHRRNTANQYSGNQLLRGHTIPPATRRVDPSE